MHCKFLVLGAGPAGVSFANALKFSGEDSFAVIEKEAEAGGLCRSKEVDGSPLDTGGGHFLDVRRPEVNAFLFRFMPESEWNVFDRDSRIEVNGTLIHHPFEANIWELPQNMQVAYLKSIAVAGCNLNKKMPEDFVEWISWKLGDKIAADYMIPYNSKMFGENLNQLGTYWLEKLPNVSFDETLLSCLNKKPYGTQPGHAQFYYPKKYGYGELWLRMGAALGSHLVTNASVRRIDFETKTVELDTGETYSADYIIFTIPWTSVPQLMGMPDEIRSDIQKLKHTAVHISYMPETLDTQAHWIYYPDPQKDYHRILVRSNFCVGSKGYWTETNSTRFKHTDYESFKNEYAYPLNTKKKPEIMKKLLDWAESKNVIGLGRWGEWQHYNSDVTVKRALDTFTKVIGKLL